MRIIRQIIIHCSATPEGKDFTVADIDRWHKERGFKKIGYHYVIYRDGSIHHGRPIEEVGAHCKGYNADSIGICYIGGLSADAHYSKDTRTPEQKAALLKLLTLLKFEFPYATIKGHNELANTGCPGFWALEEYGDLQIKTTPSHPAGATERIKQRLTQN